MIGSKIKSFIKFIKTSFQPYFVVVISTVILSIFLLIGEQFKECSFFCIGPIVYLPFLLAGCIAVFILLGMLQILHIHKQKASVVGVLLLLPFSFLSMYGFFLFSDVGSRTRYMLEDAKEYEDCFRNFQENRSLYGFSDIVVEPLNRSDLSKQGYIVKLTIVSKMNIEMTLRPYLILGSGQKDFTTDELFNPITLIAKIPHRIEFILTKRENIFFDVGHGPYRNKTTSSYIAVELYNWSDKFKEPLMYTGYSPLLSLCMKDVTNRRIMPIYVLPEFRFDSLKI